MGNFLITWQGSIIDGDGYGIASKTYDSARNVISGETLVNTNTDSDQLSPAVAASDNGEFVLVWLGPAEVRTTKVVCEEVNIAIPTLSQWGLITLSMLLSILGLIGIKKKKEDGILSK